MPSKDVLNFLYERAKARGEVQSQAEFADKHGISRPHMNQFLTGNVIPPAKAMWTIIEREGFTLDACIDVPELRTARAALTDSVAHILKRSDKYSEFLRWMIEDLTRRIDAIPVTAVPVSKEKKGRLRRSVKRKAG